MRRTKEKYVTLDMYVDNYLVSGNERDRTSAKVELQRLERKREISKYKLEQARELLGLK